MIHKLLIVFVVLMMQTATACQTTVVDSTTPIHGSGNIVTDERDVNGFTGVEIRLGANLTLIQGNHESLSIQADDNLMGHIQTEVRGNTLIVHVDEGLRLDPTQTVELTIGFTDLAELRFSGGGMITADDLDLDQLMVRLAGSTRVQLTGEVDTQSIVSAGEVRVHNFGLSSQHVTLRLDGLSMVEIYAQETLDVTISGSGNVTYLGEPVITQEIAGIGSIVEAQ